MPSSSSRPHGGRSSVGATSTPQGANRTRGAKREPGEARGAVVATAGRRPRRQRHGEVGLRGERIVRRRGGERAAARGGHVDGGAVGLAVRERLADRLEAARAGLAHLARRVADLERAPRPDDLRRAQAADRHEDVLAPAVDLARHLRGVDALQPAVAARRPPDAVELDEVRRLPVRRAVGLHAQQLAARARPVQRAVAVRPVEGRPVGLRHRPRDRLVVDDRALGVDPRREHERDDQDGADRRARPDRRVAADAVDAQVGDEQRGEGEAEDDLRAASPATRTGRRRARRPRRRPRAGGRAGRRPAGGTRGPSRARRAGSR